ncbi:MAG: stage III sporulation protein AD [Firmicutes bacterium]|nr:stage III sporulation protein AD [Bacillota bacterium]
MEVMQLVGLGLVASILVVILRDQRPEIALLLSIVVGVLVFLFMLDRLAAVLNVLRDLAVRADLNLAYLGTVLKIVGIAYIVGFGAQISRDAGEGAIANKIEFGGKILILVLAAPVMVAVLQAIIQILP